MIIGIECSLHFQRRNVITFTYNISGECLSADAKMYLKKFVDNMNMFSNFDRFMQAMLVGRGWKHYKC